MPFRATLYELRLFVLVYQEHSIGAAAAREGLSQGAVSHHIRQLELQLDITLFHRQKVGVEPTPAACHLLPRAIEILRRIDRIDRDFDLNRKALQEIVVGIQPMISGPVVAQTLIRFAQQCPRIRVRVVEGVLELSKLLRAEDIDVAICSTLEDDPAIRERILLTAPLCLVSSHKSDQLRPVVSSLRPQAIKLISRRRDGEQTGLIRACLASNEVTIKSELEVMSPSVILDLVSGGDWCVVMPCIGIDPEIEGQPLSVSPLPDTFPSFNVVVSELGSRLPAAEVETFIEIFQQSAAGLAQQWASRFAQTGASELT